MKAGENPRRRASRVATPHLPAIQSARVAISRVPLIRVGRKQRGGEEV